ncbi:hypothetical protein U0070_015280 [Myodes glareolus]|uniref:Uncharacterized protein n=1 Tax=Myodes glareolus TaxID=447135 RepID=A0AAW0K081_MYOGA
MMVTLTLKFGFAFNKKKLLHTHNDSESKDGGPQQYHRRGRVQCPLHRLLRLLRPQKAKRPQLHEQAERTQ